MDFRGERSSRRARNRPMQSCEIVGMLPAEEAAIRRALYASLVDDKKGEVSPSKPKIKTEASSEDEEDEDTETGFQHGAQARMEMSDEDIEITQANFKANDHDTSEDYVIDVDALSSPELSDSDHGGTPSKNFGHLSVAENSYPSSPQSYRSTNSLRLCLSSGSSSWMSFDSSNDSDSLSPWNSPSTKLPKKKPSPRQTSSRSSKSKRVLNFDASQDLNGRAAGTGRKGKLGKRGPKGKPRPQTAKKSAIRVVGDEYQACDGGGGGGGRRSEDLQGSRDTSMSKDMPYQAQRKFAANHRLPVRMSLGRMKPVSGVKELPKTEDFITYLCLRGSAKIPEHLQRFAKPWTPRRRKTKSKPKNKVTGSTSNSKSKQNHQ